MEFGIEEVRVIDESVNRYPGTEEINIFHDRDLFAYCGAKLASGKITFEQVGEKYPLSEIVRIEMPQPRLENGQIFGFISSVNENFGINVSDIPVTFMQKVGIKLGDKIHLQILYHGKCYFNEDILYHKSFGYVKPGEPIAYNAEGMMLGFALNLNNFMHKYKTSFGPDWEIKVLPCS